MKTRSGLAIAGLGALLVFLSACAVTGVGVEGSVGYSGGYYEPYGYDYGGWGGAYRVGPSRCCDHRGDHVNRGRAGRAPAYRPAPVGRPSSSIPGRPRGH